MNLDNAAMCRAIIAASSETAVEYLGRVCADYVQTSKTPDLSDAVIQTRIAKPSGWETKRAIESMGEARWQELNAEWNRGYL